MKAVHIRSSATMRFSISEADPIKAFGTSNPVIPDSLTVFHQSHGIGGVKITWELSGFERFPDGKFGTYRHHIWDGELDDESALPYTILAETTAPWKDA